MGSLSSRVACVGKNGAGKSTMIKLLVGEIEPQTGTVWKHPNARIAYVAQHAFHHIETFEGGVVIISHNNEFCSTLCPETWVMDSGHLETKGDAEWMLKQDTKIDDQQQLAEVTDAAGNVSKVKGQKKKLSKKEEKQMVKRVKAKLKNGEELDSDEEEFAINKDLI